MPSGLISITDDFFKNIDLSADKKKIIREVIKKINFVPGKNIPFWKIDIGIKVLALFQYWVII